MIPQPVLIGTAIWLVGAVLVGVLCARYQETVRVGLVVALSWPLWIPLVILIWLFGG